MRSFILVCLLLGGILTLQTTAAAAAPSGDKPPPVDQFLLDNGFEPVESALKKCEADAHRQLSLPYKLPPVAFTLQLAQYSGCSNGINEKLRIRYLNENYPEYHYWIEVRLSKNKTDFRNKHHVIYKLNDGSDAEYIEYQAPEMMKVKSGFNILVFNHDGWQYRLTVDYRIQKQVPAEVLVAIANSVR